MDKLSELIEWMKDELAYDKYVAKTGDRSPTDRAMSQAIANTLSSCIDKARELQNRPESGEQEGE